MKQSTRLQSRQPDKQERLRFPARLYPRLRFCPCCSSFISFWFQGPSLFAFCHAIAQGRHQFFKVEAARAGPGSKLFDQLLQPAGMLECIAVDGLLGNKGARTLLGVEDAADFHFAIGTHDRIGVDFEVYGNLADGG